MDVAEVLSACTANRSGGGSDGAGEHRGSANSAAACGDIGAPARPLFILPTSPACAALAAAAAEASAMQAAALTNQRPKPPKRIRRLKTRDGGVDHWSSNLGLNELFWMCPPGSQESFANICLVIQIGKGDLNMRFFLQISNFQVCHTSF